MKSYMVFISTRRSTHTADLPKRDTKTSIKAAEIADSALGILLLSHKFG